MTHKERLLHMVLFELFALILMAVLATFITGKEASKMAGLALSLSLIAMGWNYLYNVGYDKIFGEDRSKRTLKVRILHGLGFELGMMIISFPVLMWVLQLGFWVLLLMDIGVVLFFVFYAISFNWVYDTVRQRILTQRLVSST
ncbi:PACE efflux transporter [Vibrio ostreicida]|uniref:PACE efflux transporter n=1 Tax=Vibrio ostreicida TaxID=526588 RepID=A0ABT8C1G8_9VIBR|nr:PACE efflux transporter [Vibrio ostreicida]MDN3612065.1 PACE efflux transporter [Vibrio ostreicida]NPD08764.1 PACE efflux transporter [Vibrio ostreicida]